MIQLLRFSKMCTYMNLQNTHLEKIFLLHPVKYKQDCHYQT